MVVMVVVSGWSFSIELQSVQRNTLTLPIGLLRVVQLDRVDASAAVGSGQDGLGVNAQLRTDSASDD